MNEFLRDIVNNVIKNYAGREVVIWGYNVTSMEIEGLLEKRNIHVAFTVDSNRMLVDETCAQINIFLLFRSADTKASK